MYVPCLQPLNRDGRAQKYSGKGEGKEKESSLPPISYSITLYHILSTGEQGTGALERDEHFTPIMWIDGQWRPTRCRDVASKPLKEKKKKRKRWTPTLETGDTLTYPFLTMVPAHGAGQKTRRRAAKRRGGEQRHGAVSPLSARL